MKNQASMEEVLKELEKDTLNPELIKDNKYLFHLDGKSYRVKMPSQKELADATNIHNKEYVKLLQQDNTMVEKNLIKILKEKQGIDVNAMQEEADKIEKEILFNHIECAHKKDTEKKGIEKLRQKKDELRIKRRDIVIERAGFLAPAIEVRAKDEYYKYLTSCCTEEFKAKEEGSNEGDWILVWKNYEKYCKDNTKISYVALGELTNLMINI